MNCGLYRPAPAVNTSEALFLPWLSEMEQARRPEFTVRCLAQRPSYYRDFDDATLYADGRTTFGRSGYITVHIVNL